MHCAHVRNESSFSTNKKNKKHIIIKHVFVDFLPTTNEMELVLWFSATFQFFRLANSWQLMKRKVYFFFGKIVESKFIITFDKFRELLFWSNFNYFQSLNHRKWFFIQKKNIRSKSMNKMNRKKKRNTETKKGRRRRNNYHVRSRRHSPMPFYLMLYKICLHHQNAIHYIIAMMAY